MIIANFSRRTIPMVALLMRLLNATREEVGRVAIMLSMGFFMGMFLATISVASLSLFLSHFDEQTHLPQAFLLSGAFGIIATLLYNFLQNRIPFPLLAAISLLVIIGITAFLEFGGGLLRNPNDIYFLGFTQIIPFTFTILLIFWGSFGRLFNLRQSKKLVGTVDVGAAVASFIAFFSIPQILNFKNIETRDLYTLALFSIALFFGAYLLLTFKYLSKARTFAEEKKLYKKIGAGDFFRNKYIVYMALFIVASMLALNFVDYSFLSVTTLQFRDDELANFISYFEMSVVIFGFLFQSFASDRIVAEYGMRVAMLINPILIALFSISAIALGYTFGYSPSSEFFFLFFVAIATSKLFISSLRDALDNQTFKLYLLPIDSSIRIDVQTKIEGMVTAFASLLAGGLIILINKVEAFGFIYIIIFTVPIVVAWYFIANRMHANYRQTLHQSLMKNKESLQTEFQKEFTLRSILEKNASSTISSKVIYSLKLMEKLEPVLFENAVIRLATSDEPSLSSFAITKIKSLGIDEDLNRTPSLRLAQQARGDAEDSDFLSIEPEKLIQLGKSGKQSDRILATKLLRKLTGPKTIFILLELMRDIDPKVRIEALITARKIKSKETWPLLIETLGSTTFGHYAAAALIESGESVLSTLENAFHKSGQQDRVMLRIVQIIGRIGGNYALQLLWRKADYPDKRIVKQILYSLRYINYQAIGRQKREVISLLEAEMGKTIWNLAAIHELPQEPHFKYLREALVEEVRENYDQVTILLSLLYDPQSIQIIRENIDSRQPDNIAYALELMDVFVDVELKPKLFPLLDDLSTEEKLKKLQIFFPRENYTPIQMINYLLNRDFNETNRWTKACAIHTTAYMADFRISKGLIAQVFNRDRLLQETAAWVIYKKDKRVYSEIAKRLPVKDKQFIDSSLEVNQLINGLEDGFFLNIEMIMFIKHIPVFKNIHGYMISDLAERIHAIDLEIGETIRFESKEVNAPIFIVAYGEVTLLHDQIPVLQLPVGAVHGDLFQSGKPATGNTLQALKRSVIFKIDVMDFFFVMANHHELVQRLIQNITTMEKKNSEQTMNKLN